MKRLLIAIAVIVGVAGHATRARGENLAAQAEQHMAKGDAAMSQADYPAAIAHFKAAADLATGKPGPHLMLGLAYAASSACELAVPELELYFKLKKSDHRPAAVLALSDCRARLAPPPAPAPVVAPPEPVAPTIATRPEPPTPVVTLPPTEPAKPPPSPVVAPPTTQPSTHPSPIITPSTAPPASSSSTIRESTVDNRTVPPLRHRHRVATWVVGGVGLGILAGSLAAMLVANAQYSTLNTVCDPSGSCNSASVPNAQNLIDSGRAAGRASDALLGVGLVAVAVGVVLFFVEGRHPTARKVASRGAGLRFAVTP